MGKKHLLSCLFLIFLFISANGQQYDARGYWKMEHDSSYLSLLNIQKAGGTISSAEQSFLDDYKIKLSAYFERMTDIEKSNYYKNRETWKERPEKENFRDDDQAFAGQRSSFTQYVVSSGIWGGFYGLSFDYIFNINGPALAGFPLITGGVSSIIPIISIKDKKVTTNSLWLANHGKAMGAFQGAMLGILFTGGTETKSDGKIIVGLATASSIAFGRIGYNIGKTKNWSEGRVSLYRHYGWLMSLEGFAVMTAISSDNPRLEALGGMVGGFSGYLLANRVANRNNYTRGDVTSIQTLTLLNTELGLGIMSDIESTGDAKILIPAATAMAGTLIGQAWMKNAALTNQQGRNIALATTGGAVIGLGISIIFSESATVNYVLPYLTGLATYCVIAETYRMKNSQTTSLLNKASNGFHFSFMPQNIFINNKMISAGKYHPGGSFRMLPAFAATLSF